MSSGPGAGRRSWRDRTHRRPAAWCLHHRPRLPGCVRRRRGAAPLQNDEGAQQKAADAREGEGSRHEATKRLGTVRHGATVLRDAQGQDGSPSGPLARVPTIARHGPHFDSGGGKELTDLGGVLNDVQRKAADNLSVRHAAVSMGIREWPGRRLLGECADGSAHPAAAVVDVPQEFGLREHPVGKGSGVLVEWSWRVPRLELGCEVVVEREQRVVSQEPGG